MCRHTPGSAGGEKLYKSYAGRVGGFLGSPYSARFESLP